MLPITKHRVFHIPHSLATLAAIAAVMTALSWDRPDRIAQTGEARPAAEQAMIAGGSDAAGPEPTPDAPEESGVSDCSRCTGGGLSGLLPLVLPGASTR